MQSKSVRASGDMGSRSRLPGACVIVRSLGAVEHRLRFLRAAAVAGDLVVRGVDIRAARAHGGIDFDAPAQAEFKPRLACERRFGRNADGEHDEIAFEDASICEGGRDRARLVRFGRLARVSC